MRFKFCGFCLYKFGASRYDHNIPKHLQINMAFQIRVFTTIAVFLLVTWVFLSEAQAQVTFSRDWNPGKRGENPDFHNAMKTASAVCHLLISQVRQLAACENNRDEIEPGANSIFGGRR